MFQLCYTIYDAFPPDVLCTFYFVLIKLLSYVSVPILNKFHIFQNNPVYDVEFANRAPNYLAVAEGTGKVMVWDVKKNERKKSYQVAFTSRSCAEALLIFILKFALLDSKCVQHY